MTVKKMTKTAIHKSFARSSNEAGVIHVDTFDKNTNAPCLTKTGLDDKIFKFNVFL